MHTRVNGGAVIGLDGAPICVEVDISSGLPKTTIVGLPDAAVDEARERVRSAIRNAGAGFPTKRVTVNLAPAHIRKEGAGYDLPIAVGMLVATGQVCEAAVQDTLFLGELALDGELRHVRGVLSVAAAARDASVKRIVVPRVDAEEASLIDGIEVLAVDSLRDWIEIATEERPISDAIWPTACVVEDDPGSSYDGHDFSDVRGQEHVKRALEVAAAGGHNLLMCGPPGAGKTLLASCLPGILPPLTTQEALEVTKIASISGMTGGNKLIRERPFRAPHHTISNAGLVGGGQRLRPGEVTMAHRGVLFLDELPEFSVRALETMRQPLEDRRITISRAHGTVTYPADVCLVGAMNPCPCGNFGSDQHCTCTDGAVYRYQRRISGPVLDRIDMFVDVPRVDVQKLMESSTESSPPSAEPSTEVRRRVVRARNVQRGRFGSEGPNANATLSAREVNQHCYSLLDDRARMLIQEAVDRLNLSARGFHRVLKVARTISDLAESEQITAQHVAEAVQYRRRSNLN
ncbi:MAG: YifB family Mg chelatase-like AAA ATPase [Chloroflexi bacterium]|nr:YifB family Mg chelatase-like AAA ATPase [Chloroflexota bacterium]MYC02671.1 YifB family Mg chelatase-like AAA ATPase [Chloroflexota bacterium]